MSCGRRLSSRQKRLREKTIGTVKIAGDLLTKYDQNLPCRYLPCDELLSASRLLTWEYSGRHERGNASRLGEASFHPAEILWRALEEFVLTNARASANGKRFYRSGIDDENDIPWTRPAGDARFKAPRHLETAVESRERRTSRHGSGCGPVTTDRLRARGSASWGGGTKPLPYDKIKKYHFSVAKLQELTALHSAPP